MGARLFFKHLFNSINRRKAQPILLVFIIAIAVFVCISTVNLRTFTAQNVAEQNDAIYGDADYVVSVNSFSSRFIVVNDAKKQFGDRADICGIFDLPMFYGESGDFIYGVSTNLQDVNAIFDIPLQEVVSVREEQLSSCAFISQKLADKCGFRVGDEIQVRILSDDYSYTVFGISDHKFFDNYDIMVDISSVVHCFFGSSAVILSDLDVGNKLFFKVKSDDPDFLSDLKDYYNDMNISTVSAKEGSADGLNDIIVLMIIAIVFFVFCVVYCCCYILATQRVEETYLFYCVGAKSYMLNFISICELAIYWFVGSLIGVLVSYPAGQLMIDMCGFGYCTNTLSIPTVLFSVLLLFFATEGSLLFFIFSDWLVKRKRRKKNKFLWNKKIGVVFTAFLWVAVFVHFYYMPDVNSAKLWKISLTDYFLFIFALTVTAKYVCLCLPKIFLRKKKIKPSFLYALKNIEKTSTLSNLTSLMAIMVIALFSLSLIFANFVINMNQCRDLIHGDYIMTSVNESSVQKLRENDKIESVEFIFKEGIPLPEENISKVDIYAATDTKVFQSLFTIDELPKENEAYIFGMLAKSMHLKIGDTFTIKIGGKKITLRYAKELKVNTKGIVFNAEYFGFSYNYTVIQGKNNVSHEDLYQEIMTTLASDSAIVLDADEINKVYMESNSYGYYSFLFMLFIILLFSTIGIVDNIISSYRSRQEQFYSYSIAGMSKRELSKMKASELLISVGCGVFLAVLVIPLAFYIIYQCELSQGINLWWLFFVKA